MRIELNRMTDPSWSKLVTLGDAKVLARIDDTDEDHLIVGLCSVATDAIAEHTGLALGAARWQAVIEAPDKRTVLPGPVVASSPIVSVSVRDAAGGTWRQIAAGPGGYEFRTLGSHPGRPGILHLLRPAGWLRVTFERGWSSPVAVPAPLRQVARQLVGELLTNREASADVRSYPASEGLPLAVSATLARYRVGGAR